MVQIHKVCVVFIITVKDESVIGVFDMPVNLLFTISFGPGLATFLARRFCNDFIDFGIRGLGPATFAAHQFYSYIIDFGICREHIHETFERPKGSYFFSVDVMKSM